MTASFEEQFSILCELQEIDYNLHILRRKLNELPAKIADVQAAFNSVKHNLETHRAELSELEQTRRTDEIELEDQTVHMREREAKLYAIKTNKEYQAALKEISEGKRLNREREDRIIQAMERIETLKKEITQLEKDFAEKEAGFNVAQQAIQKEDDEIRRQIDEKSARRPELEGRIENDVLRKYNVMKQRYSDALVGVVSGICQGCSRRIPPQLYNEMLKRESLRVCPNCQRLIYVAAAPASDEEEE
ncbi:MAG: C4-type zinc ribbon domain-containing protein [Pseudomonadota bacterium]